MHHCDRLERTYRVDSKKDDGQSKPLFCWGRLSLVVASDIRHWSQEYYTITTLPRKTSNKITEFLLQVRARLFRALISKYNTIVFKAVRPFVFLSVLLLFVRAPAGRPYHPPTQPARRSTEHVDPPSTSTRQARRSDRSPAGGHYNRSANDDTSCQSGHRHG